MHWFNPLVWLVRREIDRACEFSCDEAVIRDLDINGKRNYGDTLLYVAAEAKATRSALAMCEEKRDLKERLGAIMKSKKRGVVALCVSAALLVTLAACAVALGAGSSKSGASNTVKYTPETAFAALTKYLPETAHDLPDFREEETDGGTLWFWSQKDDEGFLVQKIEVTEAGGVVSRFHYKNYNAEIPENALDNYTASIVVTGFSADFIPESELLFEKKPFENDIYDPGVVESWVARNAAQSAEYVIMVNMVYGYIEQFTIEPLQSPKSVDDDYYETTGARLPTVQIVFKDGSAVDFRRFSFEWFANDRGAANDTIAPWEADWDAENTVTLPIDTLFDVRSSQSEAKADYRIYNKDGSIFEESAQETGIFGDYVLATPSEPGGYAPITRSE